MASVKTLHKKFLDGGGEGEKFAMTTQKQDELVDEAIVSISKKKSYSANKSRDTHQAWHGDDWTGTGYGQKAHSSSNSRTVRGNEENNSGKSYSESRYQNGNWENGDYEEQGWRPYNVGSGMGMRVHHDGPPIGSRMGPGQNSEYRLGHPSMSYFADAYSGFGGGPNAGSNARPVGAGMGTGPMLGSGMKMGYGMTSGRNYDHLHSGQYSSGGSHQYQSTMMGGAKDGPHPQPYHMQGHQYPMVIAPPMYHRGVPGNYPPPGLMSNYRDDGRDHGKTGRGYMGRPHPSTDDFHTSRRGHHHRVGMEGGGASGRGRDSDGVVVAKYSVPPSHSHSAGDGSGKDDGSLDDKMMILLRGLPGSGKTTLAKTLVGPNGVICSTDDFFEENGRYVFDQSKLSVNHQKNKDKARVAMEMGKSPVIIDNTNATAWEMKPYIVMAVKEFNYSVQIQEPTTPWRFKAPELARRNIHGVSRQALDRMLEKFQHRVSLESLLEDSPTQPRRSVSAPTKPSDNDPATSSSTTQELGKGPKESSPSRDEKSVDLQNSKKDSAVGGNMASLDTGGKSKGDEKLRSVSPDARSPRSAGQLSPRARGRGRGDSMSAVGRGRGGARLGRRSAGENLGSSSKETREGKGGRKELFFAEKKGNWNEFETNSRARSRNVSDDEIDSTYWDIPSHRQDSHNQQGKEEKHPHGLGMDDGEDSSKSGVQSKIGAPLKKLLPSTTMEQYENWKSSSRNVGLLEPSSMENERSSSSSRMTGSVVSSTSQDRVSGSGSEEHKKKGMELSSTNLSANEEVWSFDVDTLSSVEGASHAKLKLSPERRVEDGGVKNEQAEKTDGDVWDSADEMDLSSPDEDKFQLSGGSGIDGSNNQVIISHDEVMELVDASDTIPEEKVDEVTGSMTKRPLKKLEEALDSCLFNKYVVEGQMDERKYSLKDQKRLVTQLVREYSMVCGKGTADGKSCVAPSGEDCISLEAVLDRARVDSLHTQLPNAVVELMFKDKQLVPRWKIDGVEERSDEAMAPPVVQVSKGLPRKESKLLKLVSTKDKSGASSNYFTIPGMVKKELESNSGNGDEYDEDVDDPAIMHIVRPKKQPALTKDSMESIWKVKQFTSDKNPLPFTAAKVAGSSTLEATKPGAWLSGASHWANPDLLSQALADPKELAVSKEYASSSNSSVLSSLKISSGDGSTSLLPPSSSSQLSRIEGLSLESRLVLPPAVSSSSVSSEHRASVKSDSNLNNAQSNVGHASKTGIKEKKNSGSLEPGLRVLDGGNGTVGSKGFQASNGDVHSSELNGYHDQERKSSVSASSVVFPSAIDDHTSRNKPTSGRVPATEYAAAAKADAGNRKKRISPMESRGAEGSSDLDFLVGCFPDLSRDQLQKLLEVNGGNVELTTISALSARPDVASYSTLEEGSMHGEGHAAESIINMDDFPAISGQAKGKRRIDDEDFPNISGQTKMKRRIDDEDYPAISNETKTKKRIDDENFPSISDETKMKRRIDDDDSYASSNGFVVGDLSANGRVSNKVQVSDETNAVKVGDMPQLLAWTDSSVENGRRPANQEDINDVLSWDVPNENGCEEGELENEEWRSETGFLQEDNLVLKLPESLAIQLQSLFGPIDQSLFQQDCTGSDLTVLLSETAAAQIYHKWVDTLKARAVEEKVRSQLRERVPLGFGAKSSGKKLDVQTRNGAMATKNMWHNGSGAASSPSRSPKVGVPRGSKTASTRAAYRHRPRQTLQVDPTENTGYATVRYGAEFHAQKRSECFQKAAEARSKKSYEVASFYAQQGHHHTQKMKEANRDAAQQTLEKNNDARPDEQLDLHGLHVNEAVAALSRRLNEMNRGEELYVITGYGSGVNGSKKEARIKPVVKNYLNQNDIWYEEKNPGLLRVVVKWQS